MEHNIKLQTIYSLVRAMYLNIIIARDLTGFGNGWRRRRAACGRGGRRAGRGRVVAGLGHGSTFVHVHRGGQLFQSSPQISVLPVQGVLVYHVFFVLRFQIL